METEMKIEETRVRLQKMPGWITTFGIIFLVLFVIIGIFFIKGLMNNNQASEEVLNCIANNSMLIVKEGCPACASQEKILGNLSKFKIIDIMQQPEIWQQYNFQVIPTWIINNKTYQKFHSIKELKELTGC